MQISFKNSVNYVSTFGSPIAARAYASGEYRYGFNGMEKDNENNSGAYDFGARVLDVRLGRWLSLDPLMAKNPDISPYVFVKNNTLVYVDIDGEDNVIYLVYLPSKDNKITVEDANKIAVQANKNFESLGLKTRVILVDMSKKENQSFNPNDSKYIDKTDGVAVIGARDEVVNYITKHDEEYGKILQKEWKGGDYEPEYSENNGGDLNYGGGGKFIALDANSLIGAGKLLGGIDKIKTGALLINHGAGHTAGQNHAHDGTQRGNSVIMSDGKRLSEDLLNDPDSPYYKNYDKLVSNDENQNKDYVNAMKERYGDNPACNTYEPK